MKLEIMSGQPDANVIEPFMRIWNEVSDDKDFVLQYMWPERSVHHPKKLYEDTLRQVSEAIEKGHSLIILTYSVDVLNAFRVAVARNKFEGAKVHQILDNGEDVIADVDIHGGLSAWSPDVFDTWENALDELLGL